MLSNVANAWMRACAHTPVPVHVHTHTHTLFSTQSSWFHVISQKEYLCFNLTVSPQWNLHPIDPPFEELTWKPVGSSLISLQKVYKCTTNFKLFLKALELRVYWLCNHKPFFQYFLYSVAVSTKKGYMYFFFTWITFKRIIMLSIITGKKTQTKILLYHEENVHIYWREEQLFGTDTQVKQIIPKIATAMGCM